MRLVVVPGDGIGPEITHATMKAVEALRQRYALELDVQEIVCGLAGLDRYGVTVRDEDVETARAADGVILGPMSVREYPASGGINPAARFRSALELYANVRPAYTRPGVPSAVAKMDLVVVRENLEDFYVDRNMSLGLGEFLPTPEVAVARDYPELEVDDLLVDAVAALLVRTPEQFDTLLTTNVFGDILTDEAASWLEASGWPRRSIMAIDAPSRRLDTVPRRILPGSISQIRPR